MFKISVFRDGKVRPTYSLFSCEDFKTVIPSNYKTIRLELTRDGITYAEINLSPGDIAHIINEEGRTIDKITTGSAFCLSPR